MRLPRCWLYPARRYRTSHLLSLLVIMIFSGWVVLSVTQMGQERSSRSTVDYEVSRTNGENHKASTVDTIDPSSLKQLRNNNNGRLLKGVDVKVKELPSYISTADTKPETAADTKAETETPTTENSLPLIELAKNENVSNHSQVPSTQIHEKFTLDAIPSQTGPDSIHLLRDRMFQLNMKQFVGNADKFPPLSEDGLVLVVQVHKRHGYLHQLFESMRTVQGIEEVLLVISHDYYYDDMMELVETVDFCRVTQIFYPFSQQVYPDVFPGSSKDDCPRDVTREEAVAMNCSNAQHPDTYGHYREAQITSIKHHWWWKANMVFDGLRELRNFSGYVLFLEEDHYLYPDFVYMAKKMIALKEEVCDSCDFINLGMYAAVKSPQNWANKVSMEVWNAGKNNMGFGMNRKAWEVIKSCSEHFCTYDDYNWDWSLNSLGQECLRRHLKVLVSKLPRIMHIGNCGQHHTKSCNVEGEVEKVTKKLNSHRNLLFPEAVKYDGEGRRPVRKKVKPFGGWGDVRDHKLCLSFVNNALRNTL